MKKLLLFFSLVVCSCNSVNKNVAIDPPVAPATIYLPVSLPSPSVPTTKHSSFYDPKISIPIEKMITILESDTYDYKWNDNTSCNVGIMAQIVSDMSQKELHVKMNEDYSDFYEYADKASNKVTEPGSWRSLINYYCGVTGKPMDGVVKYLNKAGFTNNDIIHLEWLNDKYILSKTSIDASKNYYYGDKTNLITYLRTWENIIKEQNNNLVQ